MTENDRLHDEIIARRAAQENLDAEINQIRHRLSFLAEYQEYAELEKLDLTNILSADKAENLRRKHALHEKYSQEISALNQKIAENAIALEKLATLKNQFLQEPKTLDLLKRLKADYPRARQRGGPPQPPRPYPADDRRLTELQRENPRAGRTQDQGD